MIDIKIIRENAGLVKENQKNRGYEEEWIDEILELDKKWRELKQEDDNLRAERNKISQEINKAKKEEKSAEDLLEKAKEIPEKLGKNEKHENELKSRLDKLLSLIPNIQHEGNPAGDASNNREIKKWGKIPEFNFKPRSHLELGKLLDGIDIERAVKISGEGFYILKGKIAKLQRALIQFMLDFHERNGFTEINPPQIVNRKTAYGTGNLPKFEDQLYKTNEDMFLIPTAEVPVTNIFSNETINEKELPKRFCAFTECYRTETGRKAGEEGLFRIHQFEKVEMVYICRQEESWEMLEEMTKNAEKILEQLGLHYRRLLLSTEDAGFASAKTYDLEVWSPSMNRWLETSSCSNCTDFQARRMNTKYRTKDETKFVHTLNGSGLALPRLMIALMENNQTEDGSIKIPPCLWKYTGFKIVRPKNKK